MRFTWQAMDNNGNTQKGVIEASDERQARQLLRAEDLFPIAVKAAPSLRISLRHSGGSSGHADITLFTRQLATLTNAALPVDEALTVIARQYQTKPLGKILVNIRAALLEGQTLCAALQQYPRIFDPVFCTLVKAGEKSGRLGYVLDKLADYNETRQRVKSKLTQSLIYPLILTTVAIGVVTILLTTVVPKVAGQFIHLKQQLPLSTRTLLALSDYLHLYGPWLLAIAAIFTGFFGWWLRQKDHRHRFHRFLLRIRLIGPLIRIINSTRYLRSLSILHGSGIPLLEGMALSAEGIANLEIRQRLNDAAISVREGNSVHLSLEKSDIFPPMMLYMIASGEKSGQLDSLMTKATDNQEMQLQNQIALTLAIFEPALIITMAAIVLFIVVSVLQPILQLNSLMN